MNRRIRRLGIGLVALFGLLFLQVSYIQVFAASGIAGNPANARRQIIAEYKVERGQIITADGTVVALSTPTGANASLPIRAALPAGPAVRRHHGVLLADLRQDRVGRSHE